MLVYLNRPDAQLRTSSSGTVAASSASVKPASLTPPLRRKARRSLAREARTTHERNGTAKGKAADNRKGAAEAVKASDGVPEVVFHGFAALAIEPFMQLKRAPSFDELAWFFDELANKLEPIAQLDANEYLINVVGP